MKSLAKIIIKIKNAVSTAITKVSVAIASPVLKYRKGNHEGAVAGIVAGLALLGGAMSQTFAGSFTALLGNDAQYLADFLAVLGFIALIGGFMEYRERKQ